MEEDLGRRLKRIVISKTETKIVELDDHDVRVSNEECVCSLLGKVIGDRKASLFGIKRTMSSIWQIGEPMEVREVSHNYFQFIFGNDDDKKKVLAGTSWIYENQYLVLNEWEEGLSANSQCFNLINLWVQVRNIPLNWLSTDVGLKIGKIFKKVKNIMVIRSGETTGSYLRLLVSLDISDPIPRFSVIKLRDNQIEARFRYEKLRETVPKKHQILKLGPFLDGQYGEWLKADSLGGAKPEFSNFSDQGNSGSEHSKQNHIPFSSEKDNFADQNQTDGGNNSKALINVEATTSTGLPNPKPNPDSRKALSTQLSSSSDKTLPLPTIVEAANIPIKNPCNPMEVESQTSEKQVKPTATTQEPTMTTTVSTKTWKRQPKPEGRRTKKVV